MVGTGDMEWGLESRWQAWQSHFPASEWLTRSVSTGIVIPQTECEDTLFTLMISLYHIL